MILLYVGAILSVLFLLELTIGLAITLCIRKWGVYHDFIWIK